MYIKKTEELFFSFLFFFNFGFIKYKLERSEILVSGIRNYDIALIDKSFFIINKRIKNPFVIIIKEGMLSQKLIDKYNIGKCLCVILSENKICINIIQSISSLRKWKMCFHLRLHLFNIWFYFSNMFEKKFLLFFKTGNTQSRVCISELQLRYKSFKRFSSIRRAIKKRFDIRTRKIEIFSYDKHILRYHIRSQWSFFFRSVSNFCDFSVKSFFCNSTSIIKVDSDACWECYSNTSEICTICTLIEFRILWSLWNLHSSILRKKMKPRLKNHEQ